MIPIVSFGIDNFDRVKKVFDQGPPMDAVVTQFYSGCGAAVFPEGKEEEAAPYLAETELPTSGDQYTRDMLDLGAYAVDSIRINFDLATTSTAPATVYDIQLADVERALPIEGSLVDLDGCQGESIDEMALTINRPDSGPYAVDEAGQKTDELFFESNVINVRDGGDEQHVGITVDTDTIRFSGSYAFKLKVLYEIDGEHGSVIVDDGGEPFLLTNSVCHYDAVTARTFVDAGEVYMSVDPDEYQSAYCWEND